MERRILLPYGKGQIAVEISEEELNAVITSDLASYIPEMSQQEIIDCAMQHPYNSSTLEYLAQSAKTVVILTSDHTRPMPSKLTMPVLLEAVRRGNPKADITILIATGCHRATTEEEMAERFGKDIVENEKILIHNCDEGPFVYVGTSPDGNHIELNRLACEADLLIAEGFIEPHFFAGFSGGRKSVMPGVASRSTIMYNHCADNIDHEYSTMGELNLNPIHQGMVLAARAAGLGFILNVILNDRKEVIGAVAGDMETAHAAGVELLSKLCRSSVKPADIVITTNGGFPLDQNIYQSVKGMTTAAAACSEGGIIIMAACCNDGHGGDAFFHTFAENPNTGMILDEILARTPKDTVPDQWQSQIFCKILMKHTVILVSEAPQSMVEALHLTYSSSMEDALRKARELLKKEHPSINVIPDGVSVILNDLFLPPPRCPAGQDQSGFLHRQSDLI